MSDNERCKNCAYFARLIMRNENWRCNKDSQKWCCVVGLHNGEVIQAREDGKCEFFTERREHDGE